LKLNLKPGFYDMTWISPVTGKTVLNQTISTTGSGSEVRVPEFYEDIALKIVRKTE